MIVLTPIIAFRLEIKCDNEQFGCQNVVKLDLLSMLVKY